MINVFILILILSFIITPLVLEAAWLISQPEETDCEELGEMIRTSDYRTATNKYLVDCIYPNLVEPYQRIEK